MNKFFNNYISHFKGFSKEIWILTFVTYINRAGAMVMLFLTKYMHDKLFFNLNEIGWMFVCIGFGALVGNWVGGKLTDKLGYYTVLLSSQYLTGFTILTLMFLNGFTEICIGLFIVAVCADAYKPAMYVGVSNFTSLKNRTRALSLIRLSVNLGIVTGPFLAGLILKNNNYDMLFWIDGFSCILAITLFIVLIDESKVYKAKRAIINRKKTSGEIYKNIPADKQYFIFIAASFLTAILFFQLFTVIPLYNSEKLKLNEFEIGLLMALNGLLIFLFEMPLISYLENKKIAITNIIIKGAILMSCGFLVLSISNSVFATISSVIFISAGQMLLFSFSNTFAYTRAKLGHEGKYMAFYGMSFSAAQIVSPKIGFKLIDTFNYNYNWVTMLLLGTIAVFLYFVLHKTIKKENHLKTANTTF